MLYSTPSTQQRYFRLRHAESEADLEAAQKLRYDIFFGELGGTPSAEQKAAGLDLSPYDPFADHILVFDCDKENGTETLVGTYRMLRKSQAIKAGGFYTAAEFDISPLESFDDNVVELTRSCVLPDYRTRPVLQLLWQGIANYINEHNISLMFGCGSFHGTDVDAISKQLSYLYHYHLAPPGLRAKTLDKYYLDMNIHDKDPQGRRKAFSGLPPLLKGYMRVGGFVGDGAFVDYEANTIDVCIIVQTELINERYLRHYDITIKNGMTPDTDDE